ncbi:efflux RND transporter periplasmic adaptor subunit [Acidobacteriota bacterium]
MNKKIKFILPIFIVFLGIIGAMIMIMSRPKIERKDVSFLPPLVRSQTIERHSYQIKVKSQGTVSPRTESELVSQVKGEVISVSPQFAAGGFFRKGDVLVTIDPRDYEFAMALLKDEVAQSKLRLAQEEGEARIAREEWEKLGGREEANPLVLREPQLAQAKAAVEVAEAALNQAKLNLTRAKIKAPYDGRVRSKNVDLGEYVSPGVPLATIYAVDFAEVRLPIPDEEMAYLDCCIDFRSQNPEPPNLDVELTVNYGGQNYRWSGKIIRVEGEIDPLSRMITLVAQVKDPYGRGEVSDRPPFAVGLFVEAEIQGRNVDDVAVIPRSALRGTDSVLVIDTDSRIHFRKVEVLKKDSETVIITSGLATGEKICLSPLEMVVEGMAIREMEESNSESSSQTEMN